MTEMQYVFFSFSYDKRTTDESDDHNVGLYCQFQGSRGDGMSVSISV